MGFRTHHRLLDRLLPALAGRTVRPRPLAQWALATVRLCRSAGLLGGLRRLPRAGVVLTPGRASPAVRRFRRGRPGPADRSLRLRPGPGRPSWARPGRGRPPELLRLVPL
jgi:hypothetical protein